MVGKKATTFSGVFGRDTATGSRPCIRAKIKRFGQSKAEKSCLRSSKVQKGSLPNLFCNETS